MIRPKFVLIEVATGERTNCYGDDNTITYGGLYGEHDEEGNPKYIWVENIPTQEELDLEFNNQIKYLILELESKQNRALREVLLGQNESLQILQDIESEITNLRSQLR